MKHIAIALVTACLFISCKGGGEGSIGTQWVAKGTGETNVLPLNPIRVGSVLGRGFNNEVVDGVVDLPSGRVLRMTNPWSGRVTWVRHTADGLVIVGSTTDGLGKPSQLIVPAEARVGMKWKTAAGNTFEVVERRPATPSAYGPVTRWTILQTDAAGTSTERNYLEGYGNEAALPVVFLSQDPVVAPEAAPKVVLVPIPVPDSFKNRKWVESVGLVRANDKVPGMFVANDELGSGGDRGFCGMYDGSRVTDLPAVAGPPFRRTAGPACVKTLYCARIAGQNQGFLDCSITYASGQASGVAIAPDGTHTWIPRSIEGGLAWSDRVRAGRDFDETSYRALAAIVDEQGVGKIVYNHFAGFGDLIANGGPEILNEPSSPTPVFLANNLLALRDLASVIPMPDAEGKPRNLLLQTADGMVWTARMTSDAVTQPTRQGRITGEFSVQASERGNEVLRVTADGLIQKVGIDAQGMLTLEPIAQVELKPPATAAGAFLYREPSGIRLMVAAISPGEITMDGLVQLDLYRSVDFVAPNTPAVRPAAALGLRSFNAGTNNDALVCWSGEGALDTTGWTIGGVPAAAVAPVRSGGPCAIVLRPPTTTNPTQDLRFFTVEGPVPGLGRVTFVVSSETLRIDLSSIQAGEQDRGGLAPRTNGGLVSGRRLYGPGGIVEGVPSDPLSQDGSRFMWVDTAGNGLWIAEPAIAVGGPVLRLVGDASRRITFGDANGTPQPVSILFASGGGGVVVEAYAPNIGGSQAFFVAPDGKKMPLPVLASTRRYLGRLADGTLCGLDAGAVPPSTFCIDPDGTEVVSPLPVELQGGPPEPLLPTSEGYFALLPTLNVTGKGYSALDPKTAALIRGNDEQLDRFSFCPAADGSMWGVVIDSRKAGLVPVRFRRDGIERIPIPAGLIPNGDSIARVVPDRDILLVLFRQNGSYALTARPR